MSTTSKKKQYLSHKLKGGANNEKGNRFENHFAIFKITEYLNSYSESKAQVVFSSQAEAFVDEIVDVHGLRSGLWRRGPRLGKLHAAGAKVCVGSDPLSEKVVRVASRLASGLNAPWLVVSIERADREVETPERLQRIETLFRLAEQLGAETRRIIGNDFVEEILKLARRDAGDLWPRTATGYAPDGYAWSFGLLFILQVAGLLWLLLSRARPLLQERPPAG